MERASFFEAPLKPGCLDKWRLAIPKADRALKPADHVCTNHFMEEVISATNAKYKGNVLLRATNKPVLTSNVLRIISPGCSKYLMMQQKGRKDLRERLALLPTYQKWRVQKVQLHLKCLARLLKVCRIYCSWRQPLHSIAMITQACYVRGSASTSAVTG